MTSLERTAVTANLRRNGMWTLWRLVDEANITDPVAQAEFLLRRLYPEESGAWFAAVLGQLSAAREAGTWSGFERPREPREG